MASETFKKNLNTNIFFIKSKRKKVKFDEIVQWKMCI